MVDQKSDGYSDWIRDTNDASAFRKTADLGSTTRTWPSAKDMEGMLKQGGLSDTVRTPIQFLDPAYLI